MAEPKWEKHKKKDKLDIISSDEILALVIGIIVFISFPICRIIFIMSVILWYWLKIRVYEKKIIEKEREIYNIDYARMEKEEGMSVNQAAHEKLVEIERKPMKYDLE